MGQNKLIDLLTDMGAHINTNSEEYVHFAYIYSERQKILDEIAKDFECPVREWGKSEWKAVAMTILTEKVELGFKHETTKEIAAEMFAECKRRRKQDKERIANRSDQIDMRAFQECVKVNISEYATKAEAIRDMRANAEFEVYPDSTLRAWLKDIWSKPTKPGRPKKAKK